MHTITKQALALATPAVLSAGLLAGCSSTAGTAKVHASPSTSAHPSTGTTAHPTTDPTTGATSDTAPSTTAAEAAAFAKLETRFHAQLGLYAINTGTGRSVTYQADDRFAFCSTIKAFAASVLLQRDTDQQLNQVITYSSSDLVADSPVTSEHAGSGMALSAIMAAAVDFSDNTALNLMLGQIGGPAALQSALRSLGDTTTNVDRTEPSLGSATPGDTRDTSTARAFATDLRTFVLGDALTTSRRTQLVNWLQANTTGGPYIRAAVPAGWKVGDRTGTGAYGTRNDIAVLWPPTGAPIVIAILSNRGGDADASSADALLADATRITLQAMG